MKISHYGNAVYNEIASKMTTQVRQAVMSVVENETQEPSYIAGKIVKLCSHFGELFGNFSKSLA